GNVGDNSITVLPGEGDGTFRAMLRSAVGGTSSLFVGDADGDGIPDILGGGGAYLFPGHGDGTFGLPVSFGTTSTVAVADFNGDGILDMAMESSVVPCCNVTQTPVVLAGVLAPLLSLSVSPNPALGGQPFTMTATVNHPDATGIITFNGLGYLPPLLGTGSLVNGSAQLTLPMPAGSATYQASYSGDATYAATVSPTVTVAYLGQGPGITLTSSAKPALPGQTIAITATLATSEGNAMIALYDGANLLGFQELYSAQTIFYFSLPAGTHRLRAVLPQFYGT